MIKQWELAKRGGDMDDKLPGNPIEPPDEVPDEDLDQDDFDWDEDDDDEDYDEDDDEE